MPSRRLCAAALITMTGCLGAIASCVGDDPVSTVGPPGENEASTPNPDGAGPTTDANGGGDAASGAKITMTPPRPRVVRGASVDVDITVERNGLAGDLAITLTGLPAGLSAGAASIPAAGTTAKVKLTAAASTPMGAAAITVATSGAIDLKADIVVAGTPGRSDETFDADGFLLDTAVATASFQAVIAQPDGKIIAAGTTNPAGGAWMVKRYLTDGTPDAAFNTAVASALPATGSARALALDGATGKILVVGGSAATEQLTIVRLNPAGSADQGFASAGTMVADTVTHGGGSRGNAVVVLADSSVVVAGRNGVLGLVEAYTAAGLPHPTFLRYQSPGNAELFGLAAIAGGSYLATGTDLAASPDAQLAVRLLSNGTPDAAFNGAAGRTNASGCRGYGLAIASNGDALIVGDDQTAPTRRTPRVTRAARRTATQRSNGGSGTAGSTRRSAPRARYASRTSRAFRTRSGT